MKMTIDYMVDLHKFLYILHLLPITYCVKRPVFNHHNVIQRIVMHDTSQGFTPIDLDEYLRQGYQAITTKLLDYRSEKEWRMVMPDKYQGLYPFPYVSAIYLGKNMPDSKIEKLIDVGKKLGVTVNLQTPAHNGDAFDYIEI